MNQFRYMYAAIIAAAFLATPSQVNAQWGWEEESSDLYFDVRAEIGIMSADNVNNNDFALLRPTFYGFHFETGYYWDNFAVYSGVGFSIMPFKQKQSRVIGPIPTESFTSSSTFLSLQVPLGISYKLGSSFGVHAALNLNFMNNIGSDHDYITERVPEGVVITHTTREDFDNWQLVPEATFGLDYDIGTRMRFLFFGGVSLGTVKGVSFDYVATQDDISTPYTIDFDYRWWRVGVGLTYHIRE